MYPKEQWESNKRAMALSTSGPVGLGGYGMTSKATYDHKFELLDLDNICSHVSLASKCHNLQNVGSVTKVKHRPSFIPLILAE